MPVIEPVIRPPAEAANFLLQVTTGCSANHCSFCGAYMGKKFTVKDFKEISSDIAEESGRCPDTRRVFLMDGDALAVPNTKLIPILDKLNASFPRLTRISSYANGYNITGRSPEELRELCSRKLRLIYIGLESGSREILDMCQKRSSAEEMTEAVRMSADAGIKSSVIVLLGLGGRNFSKEHIRDTIDVLNKMQPAYLSFLSVMLIPGTPLHGSMIKGEFQELSSIELLEEALGMIKGLELERTVFRSNHASNYLALEGRFPKDKLALIDTLEKALSGKLRLRPEFSRGL